MNLIEDFGVENLNNCSKIAFMILLYTVFRFILGMFLSVTLVEIISDIDKYKIVIFLLELIVVAEQY